MKKITAMASIFLMGCASVPNLKEVDLSITGLEMEFYPSSPSQEDRSIFDYSADIDQIYNTKKNEQKLVNLPELMPMTKK